MTINIHIMTITRHTYW